MPQYRYLLTRSGGEHPPVTYAGPVRAVLAALLLTVLPGGSPAQDLDAAIDAEAAINREAAESQRRVTGLARQAEDLLAEYRAVVRETENLRVYNDSLAAIVQDQESEALSINRQLQGLEATNRGVVPLMFEMIETLGRMVESDLPFLLEERRDRVRRLRDMMDKADVTTSEKYRRIMEAYQGELDYGRTTEAYSGPLPGTGQTVDFLRVGRTLLIYQSADQGKTGWFNREQRRFETLPDRYRLEVSRGLAIARNEQAPNLVVLPVPAPESAR